MMPPLLRRLQRSRSGAGAVEFALIAIPMFSLFFGTFEFVRILWTRDVVKQAAITGARCAGLARPDCSLQTTVGGKKVWTADMSQTQDFVRKWIVGASIPIDKSAVSTTQTAACPGNFSQVTVSVNFKTALPKVVTALSTTLPIVVTACFPNQS